MRKAIWISIVIGVMGFLLISQRETESESRAKGPQALVMKMSMEMDKNALSYEVIDFAPQTQMGEPLSPEDAQWNEFCTLVSQILQREDLSSQERQGLSGLLSPTSR